MVQRSANPLGLWLLAITLATMRSGMLSGRMQWATRSATQLSAS